MSEHEKSTDLPDLVVGAPASAMDGDKLVGKVGEEDVLVVRLGGELVAVGAACTHYHGPLGEGLIVGDQVRCPWHHARFCLRTGEAVGAPAIDALRRWAVKEEDGVIRVDPEPIAARPRAKPGPAGPRRVVIVGGGGAGFAAAELLRREGYDGSVTVLSADRDAPYDRPNCSKDYLAGEAPAEWMPLRDAAWYADHDIDLQLNAEATRLDLADRSVALADGRSLAYEALLLATGAEPVRLPLPGFDGPSVHVLHSLADADKIIAAVGAARRIAVVGASFIGLEAAAALRQRGLDVHVVAPEKVPLARIMGDDIGHWVRRLHEGAGIVFHLGRGVKSWSGQRLELDDAQTIEADLVIAGVGVRPRTALAESAGLKVDHGVVVDARLAAAPGVYAAGDIARFPDPRTGHLIRIEHWVHAERQGQHVARAILGDDRPFTDTPFFWSVHQGQTINYVGHAEGDNPPTLDGSLDDLDAEARFVTRGRLLAMATVGRDLRALQADVGFEKDAVGRA